MEKIIIKDKIKEWEILEQIFKKPLEQIIDIATGHWSCGVCQKKNFFSEKSVFEALKDKIKDKGDKDVQN